MMIRKPFFIAPRDPTYPERGDNVRVMLLSCRIIPMWVMRKPGAQSSYSFVKPAGRARDIRYEPAWCVKLRHVKDQQLYNYGRWVTHAEMIRLGNDPETLFKAVVALSSGSVFYTAYKVWLDKLKRGDLIDDLFPPLNKGELAYQYEMDHTRLHRMTMALRLPETKEAA